MRKLFYSLVLCFFASSAIMAQNHIDRQEILKATDVAGLQKMSKDLQKESQVKRTQAINMAKNKGWIIRKEFDEGVMELQGLDKYGNPMYYFTDNAIAAQSLSTDEVWSGGSAGLSLDGTGMTAGEWDGGDVLTTHQEFNNTGSSRVTDKDGVSSTHYHATHVGGTIIAGGVQAAAKGMAYNANLDAYDWNSDESEMAAAAAAGLLISNHSYGYGAGWSWNGSSWVWYGNTGISTQEDFQFGFYGSECVTIDNLAKGAPYYLIVKSAGNDRGDGDGQSPYPPDGGVNWLTAGYDCISYKGNAKNILTVGAVKDVPGGYTGNPADVEITDFSSWGPCDDGRIKPDICGNGYGVYSTDDASNTSYQSLNGTSMSSPNVTGSLLLLQEHYNETHSGYMKAATLKALAIHTADECGANIGPDYIYGWGLMNTQTAAEVITNKDVSAFINEESLANGGTYTLDVTATGTEPLVATIVWADPAGTPVADQLDPTDIMLVNDLDITLNDGTTTYYPYKLDGQNPANAATTGNNDVDNVEKVYIASPTAGTYTITVNHEGTISNGPQDFAIIITGISNGYAVVTTSAASNVTQTSADLSGEVVSDNGFTVTERGFVYNTTGAPTTSDTKVTVGSGVGTFSTSLSTLTQATTYYARAYAINSSGTAYGNTIEFTTLCDVVSSFPFTEDFSGGALPNCWENNDNQGNGQIWAFNNPGGRTIMTTSGASGFAILDSDNFGSGNSQNADLVTPTLDFSSVSSVTLGFEHYFRSYSGSSGTLSYSIDGGSTWNAIQTWSSSTTNATTFSQDMTTELAGEANCKIKWNYTGSWGYYWAVDDIIIDATYSVPTAEAGDNQNICAGQTATMNGSFGGTATSATWSHNGDGSFDNASSMTAVYTPGSNDIANGNVTLTLTTNDPDGTGPQVAASDNMVLTINPLPVAPTSAGATSTTICVGESTDLTYMGGSGSTFVWYTGSCGGTQVGTGNDLTVYPTANTTYYGRWENTCGESACATVTINVNPLPVAPTNVSATNTSICYGENTNLTYTGGSGDTFVWYTGSCGGTQIGTGNNYTVNPGTTTTYYGRWENTCGESSCLSVTVTVTQLPTPPTSVGATNTSICNGQSTDLSYTGGSGDTFVWYTGSCGGTQVGTGNDFTVSPTVTTTYYGRWENTCGESTCETVEIIVNEPPVAVASNDGPACEGFDIQLNSTPNSMANYSWTGPNGFSSTDQNPLLVSVEPADAGTYTVTVEDGNQCTDAATTDVVVNANPDALASNNGPLYVGDELQLNSLPDGMTSYTWAGPNGFVSTEQNPTVASVTLDDAGEYEVEVEDANGCIDVAMTEVVVNSIPQYTLTFNVSNSVTSDPIEGASIDINSATLTTDASGVATIDLEDGTYDYAVTASNYNPYSSSVTISGANITEEINLDPMGIETIAASNFSIYPNPAEDFINIEFEDEIQVFEIENKNIKQKVELNMLTPGVYHLRIVTKDSISIHKLVIQ